MICEGKRKEYWVVGILGLRGIVEYAWLPSVSLTYLLSLVPGPSSVGVQYHHPLPPSTTRQPYTSEVISGRENKYSFKYTTMHCVVKFEHRLLCVSCYYRWLWFG